MQPTAVLVLVTAVQLPLLMPSGQAMYTAESLMSTLCGTLVALVIANEHILSLIRKAERAGVHISACLACAEGLGTLEELHDLGFETKRWGPVLTELLQQNKKVITL